MLRTLLTPRWLLALVLALLFGVTTVLLGNWQYSRHLDKVAARDLVLSHYDAEPVPLANVPTDPLPPQDEWTRITVTGHYDPDAQLLVRNRPYEGTYGYEVLLPLETDEGILPVNRGWVKNAKDATTAPEVPPAPEGEMEVTGWLRPGETDLGRDLPAGQLASINLDGAAEQWGSPVLGAYLILDSESYVDAPGEQIPRPTPLAAPRTSLGSHFAYTLQWWLATPVGLILVLVMARREWQDSQDEAGEGSADKQPRREPRPKKVRIWDEEDE